MRRLIGDAGTPEGSHVLFGTLAEGLSDRFEPRVVVIYAELFSEIIASVLPQYKASELLERYRRVRRPRKFESDREPGIVYVLSRVTLGADIAVTSVILDAVKRRFQNARIILAGGHKSYELFAGDRRIEHMPVSYSRDGAIRERLMACPQLDAPSAIVVDPDSRLTQLGLMPVCPEEKYFFFESRSYGAESDDSLACLAGRWAAETFGVEDVRPYLAPAEPPPLLTEAPAAISFGVGENLAKRVRDPFEKRMLGATANRGVEIIIDSGPGGEEAERVARAVAACSSIPNARIRTWRGSFASFAGVIAQSRLFIGYDSAGQHAAAALGIPVVTVFRGFPCLRFCARWRATGPGAVHVVRVDHDDPEQVLAECLRAADRLL